MISYITTQFHKNPVPVTLPGTGEDLGERGTHQNKQEQKEENK